MGLFFNDTKPRVTKEEFKKVRSILYTLGFTTKELDKVEEIFRGDMDEDREMDKGIDEAELKKGIEWMRAHIKEHFISERKIDLLEKEMMERIKTYS
jgi:hypothetical protein